MTGRNKNMSLQKNKEILLIFVRAPERGRVKTRLAKAVGDEKALALYKQFSKASLDAAHAWAEQGSTASGQALRQVWICFYPQEKLDLVTEWLGRDHIFWAQSGAGLGERMAGAMAAAFDQNAVRVALLGTDIPQIRQAHLGRAFECLGSKDVVLGPSLDGGYWLIGARWDRFSPRLFEDIEWGGDSVFSATIDRCRENHLTCARLDLLRDVDTLADLEAIENKKTGKARI
ncbi:MAG: TIGR04282 family arsenosugar biosynthesis glycosyltransferase [Desulfobacter sp.]|nr:TIGR04282 family arsenosugar biosynthesis glycosyltransferase [Desulfobacter sp.]WDP84874.1 MAG: TIGR04282 family arsenosugar biosynthesis glycosyltransferase [Desulfobacter sp.]